MSIQVAILKILASHVGGRAAVSSLNRDIAILSTSGIEWSARMRRLAARVPGVDIFGDGYVVRSDDGWEITAEGRRFLTGLEAVTQDNLQHEVEPRPEASAVGDPEGSGEIIVAGHLFRNRPRRPQDPRRKAHGFAAGAGIRHGENASN